VDWVAASGASASDWAVGLSALAVIAVALVWVVRRIVRLYRRMLRRPQLASPATDPEQQRVTPPQTVVLPSPRRIRAEQAQASPPTQTKTMKIALTAATPVEMSSARWRRFVRIPAWLTVPFMWLGGVFVTYPFGIDWFVYGGALFLAVVLGVLTALSFPYSIVMLREGDQRGIAWVRWHEKGNSQPETPPATTAPPT
jgi:hypothetical protein